MWIMLCPQFFPLNIYNIFIFDEANMEVIIMQYSYFSRMRSYDRGRHTPRRRAARNRHTSTVQLLLGKGPPIAAITTYNNTPLHHAALSGEATSRERCPIEASRENDMLHRTPPHGMVILV